MKSSCHRSRVIFFQSISKYYSMYSCEKHTLTIEIMLIVMEREETRLRKALLDFMLCLYVIAVDIHLLRFCVRLLVINFHVIEVDVHLPEIDFHLFCEWILLFFIQFHFHSPV